MTAFFPGTVHLPLWHKCELDKQSIINNIDKVTCNSRPVVGRKIPSPTTKM